MRVELPDVNFDIAVEYPDQTGVKTWEVTISMGGVPLITRNYSFDPEAMKEWRQRSGQDIGYPHWYAADSDDAKEKCITELGNALRDALSAGRLSKPIA